MTVDEFDWDFHRAMVTHYFPNVNPNKLTLGEFYKLIGSIVKIEKWKRGDDVDKKRPLTVDEWVEAAKRGEVLPDPSHRPVKREQPLNADEQLAFLSKIGIVRPK